MAFIAKLVSAISHLFTTTDAAVVEQSRQRYARNILWREWRHSDDGEYAQRLAGLLTDVLPDYWDKDEQDRPLAMEVEEALRLSCQYWAQAEELWADPLRRLDIKQQQPDSPETLITNLQSYDWVDRFVARYTLAALGGEAVRSLIALANNEQSPLCRTATWLLHSIEVDTTTRLRPHLNRLLCPRCLVRFYRYEFYVNSKTQPFVYYGCRACGQSREFLEWTGQIVTVLDTAMTAVYIEQEGVIRGNWLAHRSLFDSDWVEIIQASDEDAERFAVQVGNDTDPFRQPRYRQIPCLVRPEARLSENSLRVLDKIFGQVEVRSGES